MLAKYSLLACESCLSNEEIERRNSIFLFTLRIEYDEVRAINSRLKLVRLSYSATIFLSSEWLTACLTARFDLKSSPFWKTLLSKTSLDILEEGCFMRIYFAYSNGI